MIYIVTAGLIFILLIVLVSIVEFDTNKAKSFNIPLISVTIVLIVLGSMFAERDSVEDRWRDWTQCEDGVTEASDDTIISDCDSYYDLPSED